MPSLIDYIAKNKKPGGTRIADGIAKAIMGSASAANKSPVPKRMEHSASLGGETLNLYFGDIHGHSDLSPDSYFFSPGFYYAYGRGAANLDFAALTDHDAPWGLREHPRRWSEAKQAAEQFNEPGRFATFIGYEWTSGDGLVCMRHTAARKPRSAYLDDPLHFGHRNVYFPTANAPDTVFSNDDPLYNTPEKLWAALKPYGAITIPHHPLGGPVFPFDWSRFNEEMEPVVEIYSSHGSSESERAPAEIYNPYRNGKHSVQTPLDAGRHFGFIASSDGHEGRAGNHTYPFFLVEWCRLFYRGGKRPPGPGLCAAYAPDLSRESIFSAIKQRRTYAVTGARIILDVRADGHFMGQRFSAPAAEPVPVTIFVKTDEEIERLELIKNGSIVKTWTSPGQTSTLEHTDPRRLSASDYLYTRVTRRDKHMAWSSPIRIDAG